MRCVSPAQLNAHIRNSSEKAKQVKIQKNYYVALTCVLFSYSNWIKYGTDWVSDIE